MSTTPFQRSPFLEWGVATRPIPGQAVCGDLHLVKPFDNGALVAVVDGLGHGDEAISVARIAIHVLEGQADQSVITLVKRCHEALINTRGVAHMLKLRGADTVIVGIQPDVAFAMVQLGLTLEGVGTALDLEEGLAFLNAKAKRVGVVARTRGAAAPLPSPKSIYEAKPRRDASRT